MGRRGMRFSFFSSLTRIEVVESCERGETEVIRETMEGNKIGGCTDNERLMIEWVWVVVCA